MPGFGRGDGLRGRDDAGTAGLVLTRHGHAQGMASTSSVKWKGSRAAMCASRSLRILPRTDFPLADGLPPAPTDVSGQMSIWLPCVIAMLASCEVDRESASLH